MPFVLIKGRFVPQAGVPDGDSIRFRAANLELWSRLEGKPARVSTSGPTAGTVQLRLEGIDAIEKLAIQPLATQAKQSLFSLVGHSPTTPEPTGYVLARMTDDESRRPIAFAFAGTPPEPDGSDVFLKPALLKRSVNYRQVLAGHAYPLYYNTLFAELRKAFTGAHATAVAAKRGVWPTDATMKGVRVRTAADLASIPPVWPKLWRRLDTYLRSHTGLAGFVAFLEAENERIDVLDEMEERGLQDLVVVTGDRVRMVEPPQNLRVVGKAGQRAR